MKVTDKLPIAPYKALSIKAKGLFESHPLRFTIFNNINDLHNNTPYKRRKRDVDKRELFGVSNECQEKLLTKPKT